MKANETKSVHVTFTLKRSRVPPSNKTTNNLAKQTTESSCVYIWTDHSPGANTWLQSENTWTSNSANCTVLLAENRSYHRKTSCPIQSNPEISLDPILYNCGGSESNSNIEILEIYQSKLLEKITDTPWFVPNARTICDLGVLAVKQEVQTTMSPTGKGLTIIPTTWQNHYFKDQITILGLSGIILQI